MKADPDTEAAIRALVDRAYAAMSTPGADFTDIFGADDMHVAGSGRGELLNGPRQVIAVAQDLASAGMTWTAEQVTVWQEGDVAWAQILGHVTVPREAGPDRVPYWTTGVFARAAGGWEWRYWGGAEPQEEPRV